jgi:hypothetical protein
MPQHRYNLSAFINVSFPSFSPPPGDNNKSRLAEPPCFVFHRRRLFAKTHIPRQTFFAE